MTRTLSTLCLALLTCATEFAAADATNALAQHFERIELVRAGDAPAVAAVRFDADADTAQIDLGLGGEHADQDWYAAPASLEIVLTSRRAGVGYVVEERAVTYLNIAGEGPHVSLDVEAISAWVPLRELSAGRFQVVDLPPARLDLTREQIIEIVRRQQPDWVEQAKDCTAADSGSCYTVTDQEFRVSARGAAGNEPIGTFRIYQPNGY